MLLRKLHDANSPKRIFNAPKVRDFIRKLQNTKGITSKIRSNLFSENQDPHRLFS
jgi:hypothetical protein